MSRVYVASSWRNTQQPEVVMELRAAGHEVYDFRNPPGNAGLGWEEIDAGWGGWTAEHYREKLKHPLAREGFAADFGAMQWADTGLLVLPCGRSAHLELGWMAGAGKRTIILTRDGEEPELMAQLAAHICVSLLEVLSLLESHSGSCVSTPSWTVHASDPLAGPIVRFWANASRARLASHEYEAAHILARRMDDWRGGRR